MRQRRGSISNIVRAASIRPPVMQALSDLHQAFRGPELRPGGTPPGNDRGLDLGLASAHLLAFR
jgi:hypothetical protein